jgi:hypothetical protein
MRFYTGQHRYYCGIDLHTRTMYVCILDAAGQVLVHQNLPAKPEAFLEVVAPYREDLGVACECIFTGYWLADLCAKEGIRFVLGHALFMKAIHGGKAKNDRIDAHKIAVLLRGGMLPQAYVYPAGMRATRDLLRRGLHLVRKRGQLLAHIQMTNHAYNLPAFGKRIAYPSNRAGVVDHFEDRVVRKSIAVDLGLLERYDALLGGGRAFHVFAGRPLPESILRHGEDNNNSDDDGVEEDLKPGAKFAEAYCATHDSQESDAGGNGGGNEDVTPRARLGGERDGPACADCIVD